MVNNYQIIRQAAIELHGLDHKNVVKVAGVVKKVINWLKGFGDPEFQRKLKELQDMSPAIKNTVDGLSVEIDKLNKALNNTDPEQFGQALEQVRPLVSDLANSLTDLDQKAAETEAIAPVDAVMNENGEVVSGEDVKRLERGWKKDPELVDKMKSMLPESLDVPVKSHINKPLMEFEWFQQFGPENIRFSENAKQWAIDKIASLVFDIEDIPMENQNNLLAFLNRNKEFIVNQIRENILNGTLRSYTMPAEGQPNKMTAVVDAGTINIPGIDFEVQFPTIFMQDKFTTFTPVKELDVYSFRNVRPYRAPKNIKVELDEGLIRDVINKNNWNIAASARELGISDRALRRKMQEFSIVREQEQTEQEQPEHELVQEPESVDTPETFEDAPVEEEEVDEIEFAEPEFVDRQEAIASRSDLLEKLGRLDPASYDSIAAIPGLEAKSPDFQRELIATGNRLGLDPSFLASVMFAESGLDHTAVNPVGGATGLIQFMPSTAEGLGTSTEELASMSDVEQLRYVEKFFKPFASKIRSAGDLRMAAFLPKFIGVPSDTIVGQRDNHDSIAGNLTYHKVWASNRGLDSDKDGIIRAIDVTGKANAIHRAGIKRGAVRPGGASSGTSGYVRMRKAPGADVQQRAQRILNDIRHQPIGTTVPFSMNGVDYMAKLETHPAGPRNPRPHPGISLFYRPDSGGSGSSPLAPMGLQPSHQFGGGGGRVDPRSQREISRLDSRIQPLATQLILRGRAIGLNPVIVSGLRSQQEQDKLYEQGRTTPGQIVTKTRNSMHTQGLAFDIAALDENGSITWSPKDTQFWDKMGTVGKSLGLTWGGDFRTFKDRPHFQYNVSGGTPAHENRRPSFMADNKTQPQAQQPIAPGTEIVDGGDARELFNFLYASGPIEKMVRRAIYKKALPTTRILITVGSTDVPFHTRVRFAKILSSALRTELDAESSIHNYGEKIEIESDISGSQSAVVRAAKGLSDGISEAFELSTDKCGGYKVSTRVFSNVKSAYALIDSETMETSFRKFAFDMVSK